MLQLTITGRCMCLACPDYEDSRTIQWGHLGEGLAVAAKHSCAIAARLAAQVNR